MPKDHRWIIPGRRGGSAGDSKSHPEVHKGIEGEQILSDFYEKPTLHQWYVYYQLRTTTLAGSQHGHRS